MYNTENDSVVVFIFQLIPSYTPAGIFYGHQDPEFLNGKCVILIIFLSHSDRNNGLLFCAFVAIVAVGTFAP